jgi:hypothetical protein
MKNLEQHTETLKNECIYNRYNFYFHDSIYKKIIITTDDNIFTPSFNDYIIDYCKLYKLNFTITFNDWTKKIQIQLDEI